MGRIRAMKITWEIKKTRGNWRPELRYKCEKEDWEVKLGVPCVVVEKSGIPKPPDNSYRVYWAPPGDEERKEGWAPSEWVALRPPEQDAEKRTDGDILPWRPGARPEYPEVEEGMRLLREAYEKALREAMESGPLEIEGELGLSEEMKKALAPVVAAGKMLRLTTGEGE